MSFACTLHRDGRMKGFDMLTWNQDASLIGKAATARLTK